MTEPILNEAVVEDLLAHCEKATELEIVGQLGAAGYPVSDFLVKTIRMAAATGAKEMFVQLGSRGFMHPPPLPPCPTCGADLANVSGEFSVTKPQGDGVTVPCGHPVSVTIHADGRVELVAA